METKLMPAILVSLLSLFCILIILRGLKLALLKTNYTAGRRNKIFGTTLAVIVAWVVLLTVLSLQGFFKDFTQLPPRPLFVILLPLPVVLIIAFSHTGTEILDRVPPHWLIFMQSFRILVEILLWLVFIRNLLPVQMTFEGRNYDLLTGVLAIPVGWFCFIKKNWPPIIAIIFNVIGFLLLLNILAVALLSMPVPFRYFMNEPSNSIVAEFPFIFIPGILVPIAYTLHIFSLRQLLRKRG
jgi:hypothetical protein